MQIVFQPQAKADLDFWIKSRNKPILKKITQLIESISEKPFEDIGKPEMLKHALADYGQGGSTRSIVLFMSYKVKK